jgi:uncharacterized protein (UPF0335 family)
MPKRGDVTKHIATLAASWLSVEQIIAETGLKRQRIYDALRVNSNPVGAQPAKKSDWGRGNGDLGADPLALSVHEAAVVARLVEDAVLSSRWAGVEAAMPDDEPIGNLSAGQLRAIIERVERLEEEKREVADQIKEVYAEAKGNGFDTKAIRQIVALRRKDAQERDEEQAILDLYMTALGMA